MPRLKPSSRAVPGPFVTTNGQVISGAGSSGQQVWIGSNDRSISAPRNTISWHGAPATLRGRIAMTVFNSGSISNASRQPPGGLEPGDEVAQAGVGHSRLYRRSPAAPHQSLTAAATRVAGRDRNSHSEAKADRLRPTVSSTAKTPTRSSSSPNRNGAAATDR